MTLEDFVKKPCPVEVGDMFYHRKTNMTVPDRLQVMEITEKDGTWFIRAKYMYHTMGPTFERTFSDIIFNDPDWIIEKKGNKRK